MGGHLLLKLCHRNKFFYSDQRQLSSQFQYLQLITETVSHKNSNWPQRPVGKIFHSLYPCIKDIQTNKRGKFLKKLWCCVGGRV